MSNTFERLAHLQIIANQLSSSIGGREVFFHAGSEIRLECSWCKTAAHSSFSHQHVMHRDELLKLATCTDIETWGRALFGACWEPLVSQGVES